MLRERLFAHTFVVLLLLMVAFSSAFIETTIVPDVRASTGNTEVVGSIAPRGGRFSVRERPAFVPAPTPTVTPTPLPTPVPISGTPFPQATVPPAPQPIAPPPTPLPNTNSNVGWLWPVAGTITTYYSAAHPAIDIAAACYTPILAATSGTITYAGWKENGGGNVISQQADNGTFIEYNHLATITVKSGTYVLVGTPIGTVGATGWANGCHLHLSILANGYWDNPLLYLP